MKFSAFILALALAGAAHAQTPDDGVAPPPGGPGAYEPGAPRPPPSPAQRAARKAMMMACQTDMQTLCAGQTGREAMMCMRQNRDQLSGGCKDAMSKMRLARRGPGGPPGDAPPPPG